MPGPEPGITPDNAAHRCLNVADIKKSDVFYCQSWVLLLLLTGFYSIIPTGFANARFLD